MIKKIEVFNMENHQHSNLFDKLKEYKPLIIIISFCLILSLAQMNYEDGALMYGFMGYFFIFLSLFKFLDLTGFVEGYATYDLITKKFKLYGYLYPFIEAALGVSYLAGFAPYLVNSITLMVMLVSAIGVLQAVLSGKKFKCACLGTSLNVPLSTVSILENFGMGLMAAYKLIIGVF